MQDIIQNKLFVGRNNQLLILKAKGHITAKLCFPLRKLFIDEIHKYKKNLDFCVDLSDCSYMDSTFIGILVGIDKKLFSEYNQHLIVLNSNPICLNLLKSMGLCSKLHMMKINCSKGIKFYKIEENSRIDEAEMMRIVFNAHNDLSEINPENKSRFSLLAHILKMGMKDIKKKKKS